MNKKFVGTTQKIKGETVSTELLLELMDSNDKSVSIYDMMHKESRNLSMDVGNSSSDQSIWESKQVDYGFDAIMQYLNEGPLSKITTIYVYNEDESIAVNIAKMLQSTYDEDYPAYAELNPEVVAAVDKEFGQKKEAVELQTTFEQKSETKKEENVKMRKPKLKVGVFVDESAVAVKEAVVQESVVPTEEVVEQVEMELPEVEVKSTVNEPVFNDKPSGKGWYLQKKYYPVVGRLNAILDNMRQGKAVCPELGVEKLVTVRATDMPRYATRPNVHEYLFIIQILSNGIVLDFPIKKSDAYAKADLYSESITFSREGGQLHPAFMFTHANGIQINAQCTHCGEQFRANTTHIKCPKCHHNYGPAKVEMSHPELEISMGNKYSRTTPSNVYVDKEVLALVMALAQLKAGLDMGGLL